MLGTGILGLANMARRKFFHVRSELSRNASWPSLRRRPALPGDFAAAVRVDTVGHKRRPAIPWIRPRAHQEVAGSAPLNLSRRVALYPS